MGNVFDLTSFRKNKEEKKETQKPNTIYLNDRQCVVYDDDRIRSMVDGNEVIVEKITPLISFLLGHIAYLNHRCTDLLVKYDKSRIYEDYLLLPFVDWKDPPNNEDPFLKLVRVVYKMFTFIKEQFPRIADSLRYKEVSLTARHRGLTVLGSPFTVELFDHRSIHGDGLCVDVIINGRTMFQRGSFERYHIRVNAPGVFDTLEKKTMFIGRILSCQNRSQFIDILSMNSMSIESNKKDPYLPGRVTHLLNKS